MNSSTVVMRADYASIPWFRDLWIPCVVASQKDDIEVTDAVLKLIEFDGGCHRFKKWLRKRKLGFREVLFNPSAMSALLSSIGRVSCLIVMNVFDFKQAVMMMNTNVCSAIRKYYSDLEEAGFHSAFPARVNSVCDSEWNNDDSNALYSNVSAS